MPEPRIEPLFNSRESNRGSIPYYEADGVTIYHGDALEILPRIHSASIRAVVTDPPYIIGAVSAGSIGSKSGTWADMMNSTLWFSTWYRQVDRVLHHTGSFWTFLNWRTVPVVMRAALDARLAITSMLCWDKEWIGPGGTQGLRPSYELVALLAHPSFAIPDRGVPDVWRCKVGSYKPNGHPAEKPERLLRRIIRTCEMERGSVVLDPFAGSGTTIAAARIEGMQAVAIEADERWCERIARRVSQGQLFAGVGE